MNPSGDWYPMTAPDGWARDVDIDTPSAARMYDYYLGGSHNFTADREAARKVVEAVPDVPFVAQANRAFLRRAVRFLVDAGVRQFLDLGSGIPTSGNVHEIAQRAAPDARVVYVDVDPVAVTHSQRILAGNSRATAMMADLRRPQELLDLLAHPGRRAVLDLDRPVALILAAVLHFVPGEQAYTAVRALCEMLVPDSYLLLSHSAAEGFSGLDAGASAAAQGAYRRTATPAGLRNRREIERFFTGLDLVEPGLVWLPQWRPDEVTVLPDKPERSGMLAGVARKPWT